MELVGIGAAVILVGVLLALAWRPPSGRGHTVDEALEDDALRREQERNLTDAVYSGDRWGIRPRR